MGTDVGTARDDAGAGATDADELIRLIMSGETPPPGLHVESAAEAIAAGRSPVGLSPVESNPFWSEPPAASSAAQPRVEAFFTRGVDYQKRDVAQATPDIASIPEAVLVASEPEVVPVVEVEPEPEPPAVVEVAAVEAVIAEDDAPEAPTSDATRVVTPPKGKGAAWIRPLPTPQTRALGADFVRELDYAETLEADEVEANELTDAGEPVEPEAPVVVAEEEPAAPPSPLDAAITPYVRAQTDDESAATRDELRQTWHKA